MQFRHSTVKVLFKVSSCRVYTQYKTIGQTYASYNLNNAFDSSVFRHYSGALQMYVHNNLKSSHPLLDCTPFVTQSITYSEWVGLEDYILDFGAGTEGK